MGNTVAVSMLVCCMATAPASCCQSDGPAEPLLVGMRGPDSSFLTIDDGEVLTGLMGPGGVPYCLLSLRGSSALHVLDSVNVTINMDGEQIGRQVDALLHPAPDGPHFSGDEFVIWDVPVVFNVYGCCYHLREADVAAEVTFAHGQALSGSSRVVIEASSRDMLCCADTHWCPVPSMTRVCE
jgi:hypothetical protein